ncbi:MAG: hypothetical protein QE285_00750 [Aquabacterium sp.]|nr:hypothetical protein [Aquabacterium sp.]
MSDIKAIEDAVKALAPQQLAEFRRWFADFDFSAWDLQIDADLAAGKLDALLAEAVEDLQHGSARGL